MNVSKSIVISCEHGGNKVPSEYEYLFESALEVLKSHRGYDIGAADLYNSLKNNNSSYSQITTTCRLLVDVNRSLYRRTLFSEFTETLNKVEKEQILNDYYYTFRRNFESEVVKLWLQKHKVLHLSVHSFTPILNGIERDADCGILYHPGRSEEKEFARLWKIEMNKLMPDFRVRFNYPYSGKPDGHVRYYRDKEEDLYLGIEFELNQKHAVNSEIREMICIAFAQAVKNWELL